MGTVTMSSGLQRAMTREATRYALTRPTVLAALGLAAVFLVADLLYILVAVLAGGTVSQAYVLLVFGVALFAVVLVVSTTRGIRRSLDAAMPPDRDVTVAVDDGGIRSETPRGSARTSFDAYRGVRIGSYTVLLPLRGSRIFSVVPRDALSEADLALLRARLGER